MKLKHYRGKLRTLSPLFIGSGALLLKNEYVFDEINNRIFVMDITKLYEYFERKGKTTDFEHFLLSNNGNLKDWLYRAGIDIKSCREFAKYQIESTESIISKDHKGRIKYSDVLAFVKDPYLQPYVPGSSIKGMLRTALLSYRLFNNRNEYRTVIDDAKRACEYLRGSEKTNRSFLSKEIKNIETEVFNTLKRDEKNRNNAVNCELGGLIVGDSRPLSCNSLTLCKKYDVRIDDSENILPIFKECIRPSVDIEFDLTIDTDICRSFTIDDIKKSLTFHSNLIIGRFIQQFDSGSDVEESDKVLGWLGSAGFTTKTIIESLFSDGDWRDALEMTDAVFKNTLGKNYRVHKHNADTSGDVSVAPHMLKMTRYNGKKYDFGKVLVSFEKAD